MNIMHVSSDVQKVLSASLFFLAFKTLNKLNSPAMTEQTKSNQQNAHCKLHAIPASIYNFINMQNTKIHKGKSRERGEERMLWTFRCRQAKSYNQTGQLTVLRCKNYMFPACVCVCTRSSSNASETDAVTPLGFYRLCLAQWIEWGNPCRCQSCPGHGPEDESNHSEKVSGSISADNLIQGWCV